MTLRLVALGDSTVEGLMDAGPDGTYVGWADRFARYLTRRDPDVSYANLGVRGQTSHEVLVTQLERAVAMQPDVVLLMAGVNDMLRPRLDRSELRDSLLTMYRRLCETGAQVVTFTMPDMTRVAPVTRAFGSRIGFLNQVIRESGTSYGAVVVDFAVEPAASHPSLWHVDRLHGNSEGHRRVAMALAAAVGLESADWRADLPEAPGTSLLTVLGREAAWVARDLVPWVWGRLRGHEFKTGGRCKRPDLLPLDR